MSTMNREQFRYLESIIKFIKVHTGQLEMSMQIEAAKWKFIEM